MDDPTRRLSAAAKVLMIAIAGSLISACSLLPEQPEPPPPVRYGEHYCYKTLAQVDCHRVALAEEVIRREGWYETPLEN